MGQNLLKVADLDVYNLVQVLFRERPEEDNLVNPVQEFAPEMAVQFLHDHIPGADVKDAVGVYVKRYLDLGHSAPGGGYAFQAE